MATMSVHNMSIKKVKKEPKMDGAGEESSLKYSVTFNTSRNRDYEIITYYIGNNISDLIKGKELRTGKFEVDNLEQINFACKGLRTIEDEKKVHYFLNINPSFIDFKYDDAEYSFNIDRLGDIAGECPQEYHILTLRFNDIDKVEELFKEAYKYYTRYYRDIEDDSANFVIYSNEDAYWERIDSRQKRDLKYIYLPKKQKKGIETDLDNFMKESTKLRYSRAGIPYKRVYLLEGVPGAGKTSLITALASKHSHDIAILSLDPKMTDIRLIQAIKNLPNKCFLVIEDIDGIFVERKEGDNSRNCITISGLLNSLDGIMTKNGLIAFITTNFKSNLDSALIRPGRVDYIMKFDNIRVPQVKEMYRVFMEESFDEDKMNKFVDEYKSLSVEIPTSLIQQYLFRYMDNPDEALENIMDIKTMKESATTNTNRNDDGKLYS
jgi:SpoVK/Ycf46/Vps4 family AAA+-type ATPase